MLDVNVWTRMLLPTLSLTWRKFSNRLPRVEDVGADA